MKILTQNKQSKNKKMSKVREAMTNQGHQSVSSAFYQWGYRAPVVSARGRHLT